MSLLIKALANAEKGKQAELGKKQSKAKKADAGLALELAPIEEKVTPTEPVKADVVEASASIVKADERASSSGMDASYADNSLSLAVEAGLVNAPIAEPQTAEMGVKPHPVKSQGASKVQDKPAAADAGALTGAVKVQVGSSAVRQNDVSPREVNQSAVHQKAAASVFVANQAVKHSSSKSALVALGIAGALMIWLGIEGSRYLTELTTPEVVISRPAPVVEVAPTVDVVASASAEVSVAGEVVQAPVGGQDVAAKSSTSHESVKASDEAVFKSADNTVLAESAEPEKPASKQRKTADNTIPEAEAAPARYVPRNGRQDTAKSVPLQVTSRTPAAAIDPILLSAYQAFSRGEDASAQQQYRQVLQRDVRNVDALLGMAAIAQRQGRDADAMGWYQKVLEIEPKNTIAQSAIVRPQVNSDVVGAESRIKNLLAQQPEAANLHAALGNLYAEQNQWAAAQEAYFNASRFAPNSADYAFNLAISLDQLGKSGLALAQYQRALGLLDTTGAATPDRTQLEARIQALQAISN